MKSVNKAKGAYSFRPVPSLHLSPKIDMLRTDSKEVTDFRLVGTNSKDINTDKSQDFQNDRKIIKIKECNEWKEIFYWNKFKKRSKSLMNIKNLHQICNENDPFQKATRRLYAQVWANLQRTNKPCVIQTWRVVKQNSNEYIYKLSINWILYLKNWN